MKKLITLIAICLSCCFALPAQNVWKPVGAPGYILAVDNHGYLYSTSFELGECLCRSIDEGLNWEPVLTGSFYDGPQMAVSKQGRIFAIPGLGSKVYFSDDDGDTWQTTSNFPSCLVEGMFAVSNDTLLIWGASTFGYESLHFTLDGGVTWSTADLAPMGQTHHVGDVIANEAGDVFVSFWSNNSQDDGIYCSNYTDMEHWDWQLVAFPNISIKDMEFDPEGNVVAVASAGEFAGFQQVPGFYLAGNEAESLGIADNGTVYICNKHGDHAVLASSQDHGAHFHEMGEMLPISLEDPDGILFRGHDNYLYFYGNSYYWKSFDEAGFIGGQHTFAPQGAEWYFNLVSFMGSPISYYHMEVLGDTVILGHSCSIVSQHYLGGNGGNQYVYEENRKVYWYNQTLQAFTTLYDFAAEAGESWLCDIDTCTYQVMVQSVSDIVWGGRSYRVQQVVSDGGEFGLSPFSGTIIDGMGYTSGLFPYPYACEGVIHDGQYPEFLRCYLVDGEMLYHEGVYACDAVYPWNTTCWDGTVAEAYEGGDGTEENPFQIATPQQLALLAEQTYDGTGGNAHYILVDDICLNDEDGRLEWPMIGRQNEMNHPIFFQGVFDGNGHSIKGMYISVYHVNSGLFGEVNGAVIKNLTVDDSRILNGNGMGIIIGHAQNTDILNCSVANCELVNMISSGGQGGIVGDASAGNDEEHTFFIKDCTSNVRFSSSGSYYSCGGIVGYACVQKGVLTIENCVNYSNIMSGEHLGGILGTGGVIGNDESSAFAIRECKNYGEISLGQFGGGIGGYCWDIEVYGCFNWGDVTAEYNAGGIVGINMNGIIAECANMGNVKTVSTSGSMVGGIVADHSGGLVANSYNRGEVSAIYGDAGRAVTTIGGIVGRSTGSIYNVYNAGAITIPELPFNSRCGAILGQGDVSDHYLNCYWLEQDTLPACGNIDLLGSSSFNAGEALNSWVLSEPQYGTYDLLEALNLGAVIVLDSVPDYPYLCTWLEDVEGTNDGYPVLRPSSVGGDELNAYCEAPFNFGGSPIADEGTYGAQLWWNKPFASHWFHYDEKPYAGSVYCNYWGIKIPAEEIQRGDMLTHVAFYKAGGQNQTMGYSFAFGFEGDTEPDFWDYLPGNWVQVEPGPDEWVMVKLGNPIVCEEGKCLWIVLEAPNVVGNNASYCQASGNPNACWSSEGSAAGDWMIRGYFINDVGYNDPGYNEDLDHYNIYRGSSLEELEKIAEVGRDEEAYFDTLQSPFGDYYYQLTASYTDGRESVPARTGETPHDTDYVYFHVGNISSLGSEWYYEIQNENGSITYQHLEYVADTTVNDKDVKIIIRTNTLYDKGGHDVVTREYIYEDFGKVYWWNETLQDFTLLYDLGAQIGDEWIIWVGTESITMHVDTVEQYEYEGITYRMLHVSDADDLFSGAIMSGVGHLSSFFPERLMTRDKGYRVNGLRCYWINGDLVFTMNRDDCDAIYINLHIGIEENGPSTGSGTLTVYPNPTNGVLFVQTLRATSLQAQTYHITDLMGQTLMSGTITAENQQIDVSNLPQGMYFISVGDDTRKFVVNK